MWDYVGLIKVFGARGYSVGSMGDEQVRQKWDSGRHQTLVAVQIAGERAARESARPLARVICSGGCQRTARTVPDSFD